MRQADVAHLRTSPGSSISPDSTTSTSGRLATSSADRSSGRATSVMTAARLDLHDVEHPLAGARGGGDDDVHVGQVLVGVAATWIFARGFSRSMSAFSASSLAGLRGDQPQLVAGHGQQPRAHRADRAGRTDHHRLALHPALLVDFGDAESADRVVRGPQRTGGAVAVAGGDRQRRALGHRHTGVADDLGERAEAHDLGAELLGHVGGRQQPRVGELRVCAPSAPWGCRRP